MPESDPPTSVVRRHGVHPAAGAAVAALIAALVLVAAYLVPSGLLEPPASRSGSDAGGVEAVRRDPVASVPPEVAGETPRSPPAAPLRDGGPVLVEVRLGRDFVPTENASSVGARTAFYPGNIALADGPPPGLVGEPAYRVGTRRYGRVEIGSARDPGFALAFDVPPEGGVWLWIDLNRNGDLRDDGAPIANQVRSSIFSAEVRVPMAAVRPELANHAPDYVLRILTTRKLWEAGKATFYSVTALEGHVTIGPWRYRAYVTEIKGNDGDFTNDGLRIDFDSDDRIARDEHWPTDRVLTIRGVDYRFDVDW